METVMRIVRVDAARRRPLIMMKLIVKLGVAICPLILLPGLALAPVGCGISKPAGLVGTGGDTTSGSGGAVGSGGTRGGGGAGDSAGTGGGGDRPGTGGAGGMAGAGDTGGAGDGVVATAGLQYNGVIRFFRGAP
jgi:hypothetical protein